MKKEKKNRLDKGASGSAAAGFIGFGAFSNDQHSSAAGGDTGGASTGSSAGGSAQSTLRWSPVYTGQDAQTRLSFKKLAQKQDATTKVKAMDDLQRYCLDDTTVPKRDRVVALCHFVYLYHTSLSYHDHAAVRAAALAWLHRAQQQLPKAWQQLVMNQHPELYGMVYCAQEDGAANVQATAKALCDAIRETGAEDSTVNVAADGLVQYVKRILAYGRPLAMHEALFARNSNSSGSNSNSKAGTSGGSEGLSEKERDTIQERFERIVGVTLSGLTLWIQQHPQQETSRGDDDDNSKDADIYDNKLQDKVLFKYLSYSKP